MEIRRKIAKRLREGGHEVLLMEDDPDRPREDLIEKFDRLLRENVTDVVVYWPPAAKMQTTFDEFILLCDRRDFLTKHSITVWLLHHSSVAAISKDEFRVLEAGQRSRYLTVVASLGVESWPWEDDNRLMHEVRELSEELDA
ncbi:MAG: hypothetical protein AAB578_01035 [Elusimicrobiota bacterium]